MKSNNGYISSPLIIHHVTNYNKNCEIFCVIITIFLYNLYNKNGHNRVWEKTRKCADKPRQKRFPSHVPPKLIMGTPQQQQRRTTIISHYCFSLIPFLGATYVTALPGCCSFVWHHHILPLYNSFFYLGIHYFRVIWYV